MRKQYKKKYTNTKLNICCLSSAEEAHEKMLLYNYSPSVSHTYYTRFHHGRGFGSLFARLFSRVAAKTAAKAALSVAKVAGRKIINVAAKEGTHLAKVAGKKILKVAAKQGPRLAKKAGKQIIKKAAKFGADAAIKGIDSLEKKAINKGLPASAVHNVSNLVRDRTQAAAKKFTTTATHKVNTGINNIVRDRLPPSLTPSHKKQLLVEREKTQVIVVKVYILIERKESRTLKNHCHHS